MKAWLSKLKDNIGSTLVGTGRQVRNYLNSLYAVKPLWAFWVFVLIILIAGYLVRGTSESVRLQLQAGPMKPTIAQPLSHDPDTQNEDSATKWTCSMHPQIQTVSPGQCPICGMDLIVVETHANRSVPVDEKTGERLIALSPYAAKLAQLATAAVERKFVENEVRLVGKINYDESKVVHVTAWVEGRLDRLYVDYTGIAVKKGDHMVYLYSPELYSAQEELIGAIRTRESLKQGTSSLAKTASNRTAQAAREKLVRWGLTKPQVTEIIRRGKAMDHIDINAPVSGIVVKKEVNEGMYVKEGQKIYTIADLSKVWAELEAYESDLPWLHYGQKVDFHTESVPGEIFQGRISFIDPVLNQKTRTIRLRVNVDNADGRLKPDMFVSALVRVPVDKLGQAMDAELTGKYIGPMHPEIVQEGPGKCPICGMDLVEAERLGFTPSKTEKAAPLVIPASAVLKTGKRAIVYVAVPNQPEPTYVGREISLGPRAGDHYLVREGLQVGERVVTNGNFKIDSALQIQAKKSMMNPTGGVGSKGHPHGNDGGGSMQGEKESSDSEHEGH